MVKVFYSILFVFLGMSHVFAQITGSWKGKLEVPDATLNLIFHITEKDGNLSGTMDSPEQGATSIPLTSVAFENNKIRLSLQQAGMSYAGELKGSVIEGVLEQSGAEFPLKLEKTIITKPGDTELVSSDEELAALMVLAEGNFKYNVEDYFQKPNSSGFQLSPDGRYLSYREKDEHNKRHVFVKEIATGKVNLTIEEGEELIRSYGWINGSRLFYAMDQGGDENYHIYAVNLDGSNNIDLTPYEGVQAQLLSRLKEQPDYIIVSLNKDNKQVFEPYRLDVNNGETEKLYTNDDPAKPIMGYDFDKDGNLRGFGRVVDGTKTELYVKTENDDDYRLFKTTNWDENFTVLMWDYASDNPDQAYVLTNLDSDKARIVLYDFKTDKIIEEVYSHTDYDATILGASRKRHWEIDYLGYEGEKVEIVPVSDTFKKIYDDLKNQFPDYEIGIAAKTDEEDSYLIFVQSDKLYGRYYNYDPRSGGVTLLYDLMPQLKEEDMAVMKPISFESRDGLTIHGYITLPQAAMDGKKVPLVVNPHGGPQGVRDSWGFNPEAQLFASRGYATLQVNFRVSGGYGKAFLRAGFKQIGRKAMDDVEDGVRYAISQGWVDTSKIAIYGASHGGYATLMGLIKTPDLYVCGVNYVGVSNIETLFASIPEYWEPYRKMLYEIWYDINDPEEAAIAKEASPIYQVEKITKPLFVVQGANDPRVNINESDQIVRALRQRGYNIPYMVKYDEGHGFAKEENSINFYRGMMGFLSQHLD